MKPAKFLLGAIVVGALFGSGLAVSRWRRGSAQPSAAEVRPGAASFPRGSDSTVRGALPETMLGATNDPSIRLSPLDWARLLRSARPEDLPELVSRVAQFPRGELRMSLLRQLAARWGRHDPQTALAWTKQLSNAHERRRLETDVLVGSSDADPAAAAKHAFAIVQGAPQSGPLAAIVEAWAEQDSAAALAWVQALPSEAAIRRLLLSAVAQRVADSDPVTALKLAETLPPNSARTQVVGRAIAQLARRDLATALAEIEKLPAGNTRVSLYQSVVDSLVKEDPLLAGEFALTLPRGEAQTRTLRTVTAEMADRDPAAAFAWIEEHTPEGSARQVARAAALTWLAQSDPLAAAQFFSRFGDPERAEQSGEIARAWAGFDPTAAAEWVKSLPDSLARNSAVSGIAGTWAKTDPVAALAFARAQSEGPGLYGGLSDVGLHWARRSPESAIAALADFPAGSQRLEFLGGVLEGAVGSNPQAATALYAKQRPEDQYYTLGVLVSSWAAKDRDGAAEWLLSLDDDSDRTRGVDRLVNLLGGKDPQWVGSWIARMPADAPRDTAISAFVDTMRQRQPREAAPLVLTVADPTRRHELIEKLANNWLTYDRASASAWLEATDLPAERKAKVLGGKR